MNATTKTGNGERATTSILNTLHFHLADPDLDQDEGGTLVSNLNGQVETPLQVARNPKKPRLDKPKRRSNSSPKTSVGITSAGAQSI